jgi:hypothetical protein
MPNLLKAFLAGFLSTLVFHQGLLALLHASGATDRKAFTMAPTPPLGVPAVISLAFWGGIWGILLWLAIRSSAGAAYWLLAIVLGALAPSIIAFFVVFPLKGQPVAGGWQPAILVGALLLNGAWGFGVALFQRLFGSGAAVAPRPAPRNF